MRYTTQFEYKTIVLLFGKEELPKAEEFESFARLLLSNSSVTALRLCHLLYEQRRTQVS